MHLLIEPNDGEYVIGTFPKNQLENSISRWWGYDSDIIKIVNVENSRFYLERLYRETSEKDESLGDSINLIIQNIGNFFQEVCYNIGANFGANPFCSGNKFYLSMAGIPDYDKSTLVVCEAFMSPGREPKILIKRCDIRLSSVTGNNEISLISQPFQSHNNKYQRQRSLELTKSQLSSSTETPELPHSASDSELEKSQRADATPEVLEDLLESSNETLGEDSESERKPYKKSIYTTELKTGDFIYIPNTAHSGLRVDGSETMCWVYGLSYVAESKRRAGELDHGIEILETPRENGNKTVPTAGGQRRRVFKVQFKSPYGEWDANNICHHNEIVELNEGMIEWFLKVSPMFD